MIEEIINQICEEIAQSFCEMAMDVCWSLVGNAGQESIVGDVIGDFEQVDDVANGDYSPVSSSHDEAVGMIMEAGNSVLEAGADLCALIRDTFELFG